MQWAKKQNGFTIVELLIVIVVIAILAAITIVAYNGIQNRAKASAAQQGASQASKKILAFAVDNTDSYPEATSTNNGIGNLAALGIVNNDTTYQYSANNTANPKTYCITATNGNQSFYLSNTVTKPTSGGCAGHSANGVEPTTNYVNNPSFETSNSTWGVSVGTGGTAASSRPTTGGVGNGAHYRLTWSVPPTSGTPYITNGSGGVDSRNIYITGGQPYTASGWVRASWAARVYLSFTPYDAADSAVGGTTGTNVDLVPNTWTRINVSMTVNSSVTTMVLRYVIPSAGLTGMAANSTLDIDQVMMTQGTTIVDYADGNSPNWVWNGTPNLSTSKGMLP